MAERECGDDIDGDEMESEYAKEVNVSDVESEQSECEGVNGSKRSEGARRSGAGGGRMDFDRAVGEIKEQVAVISGAVSQEGKGKLSFNRADQLAVKGSLEIIQSEVIEVLLTQLALERENARIKEALVEERSRRMEEERKRMEAERRMKRMELELEKAERAARERADDSGKEVQKSATGVVPRKKKVQELRSESDSESERDARSGARTYAQVSAKGKMNGKDRGMNEGKGVKDRERKEREEEREGGTIKGRVIVAGDEGWKTPPNRRQGDGAFILTGLGPAKGKDLMGKVVRVLQAKEIGGPPQGARVTKEGKVVLVPKDKAQAKVIGEKLGKMVGIEVKRKEEREPLLIITGMEAGLTAENIREGLERENDELKGMGSEFKIWKRMPCGNPWKENVVVRLGNERFRKIVKRGKIDFGCVRLYAEEFLDVAMCYRCCRFGHVQRHCGEQVACLRCGKGHDARECKEERLGCVNCYRLTGRRGEHAARDQECPAFRKAVDAWRKGVKYD